MSKSGSRLFEYTAGFNRNLVDELIASSVKCSPDKILYILKDKDGKIIWLETGERNIWIKSKIKKLMAIWQHILKPKINHCECRF